MIDKNTNSRLLPNDNFILSQPILIQKYGRSCAAFLQQVHYWLNYDRLGINFEEAHWISNTMEEWGKELCLSSRTIGRCIKKLREEGILLVKKLAPKAFDKTNYYTIDYDVLSSKISDPFMPKKNILWPPRVGQEGIPNILRDNNKSYKSKNSKKIGTTPVVLEKSSLNVTPSQVAKTDLVHIRDMFQATVEEISTQKPDFAPKLNKETAKYLGALRKKFPTLEKWRKYLRLITSSTYLMSKKFILRLKWLLKFSTIDRILSGDLGVNINKFTETIKSQENSMPDAEKHIQLVDEPEPIKRFRTYILSKVGSQNYNSWFTKISIDSNFNIKYPNNFVKNYMLNRFDNVLMDILLFNREYELQTKER